LPFKQSPIGTKLIDKSIRTGLLPRIEMELMALRDIAKSKMTEAAKSGQSGLKSMYNSRQNEIKVICNSIYGILNASGGRLTRPQLAESVTSQGRLMIMQARRIAEELSPTNHVIYGGLSINALSPHLISPQTRTVFSYISRDARTKTRRLYVLIPCAMR
jgi:DNA polymerase elongation subunit (family B)